MQPDWVVDVSRRRLHVFEGEPLPPPPPPPLARVFDAAPPCVAASPPVAVSPPVAASQFAVASPPVAASCDAAAASDDADAAAAAAFRPVAIAVHLRRLVGDGVAKNLWADMFSEHHYLSKTLPTTARGRCYLARLDTSPAGEARLVDASPGCVGLRCCALERRFPSTLIFLSTLILAESHAHTLG